MAIGKIFLRFSPAIPNTISIQIGAAGSVTADATVVKNITAWDGAALIAGQGLVPGAGADANLLIPVAAGDVGVTGTVAVNANQLFALIPIAFAGITALTANANQLLATTPIAFAGVGVFIATANQQLVGAAQTAGAGAVFLSVTNQLLVASSKLDGAGSITADAVSGSIAQQVAALLAGATNFKVGTVPRVRA